jgi:hypothetical protein
VSQAIAFNNQNEGEPMRYSRLLQTLVLFAATAVPAATYAQSFRAYLSSTGVDTHPCTVSQPCRLLPAALNAIVDGGEVWMLDSANYNSGTVHIAKSATIMAIPGAIASVSALGGPAISVETTGVNVVLRNLVFVPFPNGGGTYGLRVTDGYRVTVEKSVFSNLPAINVNAPVYLNISDTDFRNNGSISPAIELNGGAIANISNIRCAGFASWCVHLPGLTAGPETRASVSDSIMANGWGGVGLNNGVANVASRASVTRSTMTGMTYGVGVACEPGLCTATISANQIHGNSFGVYTNGGVVESAQNNSLRQNGMNVSGTPLMNVGQQ